jgi:predicted NAD/FAD-dependent oxidoreductase
VCVSLRQRLRTHRVRAQRPLRLQGRERADGKECWVALTTAPFAQRVIDEHPMQAASGALAPQTHAYREVIRPQLVSSFLNVLPWLGCKNFCEPEWAVTHRWGHGFVKECLEVPLLEKKERRIVFAGDFCMGSSFESAAASGLAAADAVHAWSQ